MTETIRMPSDFQEYPGGPLMDNLSGEIRYRIAEAIKEKVYFSKYAGWDFLGLVWWNEILAYWCVEVWQWHKYKQTILNETLEGLREEVQSSYGTR